MIFYLPGRFSFAQELFANYADCDGVYEAAGDRIPKQRI
jgi:hypothetical protein